MNDNQRTAVLTALAVVRTRCDDEHALMARACLRRSIDQPTLQHASRLLVARDHVELPEPVVVIDVLHAVAHLSTHPIFPAHGAEFCANLIDLVEALAPGAAASLGHELTQRRVHSNPEHRRRAVLKAVLQRAVDGTAEAEAILDDPPTAIIGGPLSYSREDEMVWLGTHGFHIDRLRYLAKVC